MRISISSRIAALAIGLAIAIMAFGGLDGDAERALGVGHVDPLEATGAELPAPAMGPDTTARALWAHLQEADYRANWDLWPGKRRLYTGTEPHGMLLTTYTNDLAHEALIAGNLRSLPARSIIVKENYMPDSTFAAATVMVKVPGYNPEHQDWLFAKYDALGQAQAFGRVPMCQSCHGAAASGAYLYTAVEE